MSSAGILTISDDVYRTMTKLPNPISIYTLYKVCSNCYSQDVVDKAIACLKALEQIKVDDYDMVYFSHYS